MHTLKVHTQGGTHTRWYTHTQGAHTRCTHGRWYTHKVHTHKVHTLGAHTQSAHIRCTHTGYTHKLVQPGLKLRYPNLEPKPCTIFLLKVR